MIYEYLLSMINKATGGSTKQLGRTFLRERENNGWLYLEGMFCPTVAVKLVKPYIILTFLSTAAVRKSSQKGFFCVQGVSHRKTSHLNYVVSVCQKFCFGLRRAKSPKTQQSKVARIPLFLHYVDEWLLQHVITDDSVLMLDSTRQRMSFRERHVRGNGVSRDTRPRPIVYPKLCELAHLTASQISLSCRWRHLTV